MIKNIMVCSFDIHEYDLSHLRKMTAKEIYELASMHKMLGDSCADVIPLSEFQDCLNGDFVDVDSNWFYFVEV